MNTISGLGRYINFDLRKAWIITFLETENLFWKNNSLGPIQLKAFINYLKDGELIDQRKKPTELFYLLKTIYLREGIDSTLFWGIYWVNLCFNSNLFKWWANQKPGIYTREYLISLLFDSYGKFNRTIINGYNSLVGTLEKTPIGDKLGQGIVRRNGNKRVVLKEGKVDIPPLVILFNLYKLTNNISMNKFNPSMLEENFLSPQKIFYLDSKIIDSKLKNFWKLDCLDMIFENETLYYVFKEDINIIDILMGVYKNEI